jgi:hypothetical protein
MSNKTTIGLALVAGFVGGTISHVPISVHAQTPPSAPPEIRAQKFVLVDENGTPRGVFGFQSDGFPDIQVRNKNPKGFAKMVQAEVGRPEWIGVVGKGVMPDLRFTHP